MKPTRPATLGVVAVIFALATWLLLRVVYPQLPPLPWTGVPALIVAAAAEAWTGRDLRARIAGRRGKPAAPLFVSRMVALAKASALVAAAVAGVAAGFDIYLSGSLNAAVPRQDALTAAVTLAAAVILACAALYLEYCCRVPDAPDRGKGSELARCASAAGAGVPWERAHLTRNTHDGPFGKMAFDCRGTGKKNYTRIRQDGDKCPPRCAKTVMLSSRTGTWRNHIRYFVFVDDYFGRPRDRRERG